MPGHDGNPDGIQRATFTVGSRTIPVHFNPESLTLTVGNSFDGRGTNDKSRGESGPALSQQVANSFAMTLSMKLQFDTTDTGSDVRAATIEFQRMLRPSGSSNQEAQVVLFEWGTFRFSGTFRSISETVDYFSTSGVPLRASVDLSMSENRELPPSSAAGDGGGGLGAGAGGTIEIGARAGISVSAAIGGDSFSARAVAELNGEESLRRLSGAPLEIDAEISLQGPVAFASGGVSFGASAGIGVSGGAGIGVSGGLGLELGVGGEIGAGVGIAGAIGVGGALGLAGGLSVGIGAAPAFGVDVSAQLGLGFGAAFNAGGAVAAPGDAALPAAGPGVAPASFAFAGAAASIAGASAPARAFAAEIGSSAAAAAAAGVAGSSSGLLSPAVGPVVRGSGIAFAMTEGARARANVPAFAASDPAPTTLQGPVWGSRASAGVPAAFGAFSGLHARPTPPRVRRRLDPRQLLPAQPDTALHTDAESAFEIGGRAVSSQASGLRADVGANTTLRDRIRFDEE